MLSATALLDQAYLKLIKERCGFKAQLPRYFMVTSLNETLLLSLYIQST